MIIACDGMWDKLTYDEAAKYLVNLRKEGKDPKEAAQWLTKKALEKGSTDNVSAIIVYFNWQ